MDRYRCRIAMLSWAPSSGAQSGGALSSSVKPANTAIFCLGVAQRISPGQPPASAVPRRGVPGNSALVDDERCPVGEGVG